MPTNQTAAFSDTATARYNMVEGQVRPNKVTDDRLVEVLRDLPRERFVPDSMVGVAYVDESLTIAPGRFLMEPMIQARLLQAAEIGPRDVVLDIGAGTGYASAVLGRLAASVVALESDPRLAERANAVLQSLAIDNVVVVRADLASGYSAQAPYDAIVLEGAVTEVPAALTAQLAEGGRLVAVLAGPGRTGQAWLYRRIGDCISKVALFDATLPVLPGFAPSPGFVF